MALEFWGRKLEVLSGGRTLNPKTLPRSKLYTFNYFTRSIRPSLLIARLASPVAPYIIVDRSAISIKCLDGDIVREIFPLRHNILKVKSRREWISSRRETASKSYRHIRLPNRSC